MNEFRIEGPTLKKTETGVNTPLVVKSVSLRTGVPEDLPSDENAEDESAIEDRVFVDRIPLINQLLNINANLEMQIETLRLRLVFDTKRHEDDRNSAIEETDIKLKTKDQELLKFRSELQEKGQAIDLLSKVNKKKVEEITDLQRQISDKQKDIGVTRKYALDLQKELGSLQKENKRLEVGFAYGDKERHINVLKKEVDELNDNLSTLESELEKARGIISAHGGKVRLLENDKKNMQIQFKEEIARISHSMRHEIEKMRDVMKGQWDEMKSLREQNEGMTRDIKEIKELLLTSKADSNRSQSPVFGHAFKPSLTVLKSDTKTILTGKRK